MADLAAAVARPLSDPAKARCAGAVLLFSLLRWTWSASSSAASASSSRPSASGLLLGSRMRGPEVLREVGVFVSGRPSCGRLFLRLASVNVADTCCVDRHLDHVAGPCASVLPMLVATSFVQSVERFLCYAAGPAGLVTQNP